MKILGRWSVVSFINFWVQLIWALVFVLLCLLPLTLFLEFFGLSIILIELPINLKTVGETFISGNSFAIFTHSLEATYYPAPVEYDGINWPIVLINLAQMAGLGFTLYGLSQLKDVLRNLLREKPFAGENHSKLQIIAVIIMLISPLLYGYRWLSYWYFESFIDVRSLKAAYPDFDFSYLIMGLIVLVVAEIFRQATEINEEQKLTV